tara:strand:- start:266 stop:586 length:321 start_codon:yes stop_codon:yes gene_type:complete
MARTKGSKNKITTSIKEAVNQAFKHVNGKDNAGLIKLARDEPKIFYTLVGRCIPPEQVSLAVTVAFDLGQAMLDAQQRKDQLIDVTPTMPVDSDEIAKPLITIDKE